jgi:hypothetical protein
MEFLLGIIKILETPFALAVINFLTVLLLTWHALIFIRQKKIMFREQIRQLRILLLKAHTDYLNEMNTPEKNKSIIHLSFLLDEYKEYIKEKNWDSFIHEINRIIIREKEVT